MSMTSGQLAPPISLLAGGIIKQQEGVGLCFLNDPILEMIPLLDSQINKIFMKLEHFTFTEPVFIFIFV